jgi:hypothetical protein
MAFVISNESTPRPYYVNFFIPPSFLITMMMMIMMIIVMMISSGARALGANSALRGESSQAAGGDRCV